MSDFCSHGIDRREGSLCPYCENERLTAELAAETEVRNAIARHSSRQDDEIERLTAECSELRAKMQQAHDELMNLQPHIGQIPERHRPFIDSHVDVAMKLLACASGRREPIDPDHCPHGNPWHEICGWCSVDCTPPDADDSRPTPEQVECHAEGDTCHGCDHYHGKAAKCRYAPDDSKRCPESPDGEHNFQDNSGGCYYCSYGLERVDSGRGHDSMCDLVIHAREDGQKQYGLMCTCRKSTDESGHGHE